MVYVVRLLSWDGGIEYAAEVEAANERHAIGVFKRHCRKRGVAIAKYNRFEVTTWEKILSK